MNQQQMAAIGMGGMQQMGGTPMMMTPAMLMGAAAMGGGMTDSNQALASALQVREPK